MERCAHTLLCSIGDVEAQTAKGHAVRDHILRPCSARMVPHHVAVRFVAEEVDAFLRSPVRVWHAHNNLGHDHGSWLVERFCDVEVRKGRRQEREVRVERPTGAVNGIAQRVVHAVVGERVQQAQPLCRQNLCEEGNVAPLLYARLRSASSGRRCLCLRRQLPSRAGDVRASCGARLSSASDGGCSLFRPRLLARRAEDVRISSHLRPGRQRRSDEFRRPGIPCLIQDVPKRARALLERRRASRRGWRQGSIRAERRRDASVGRRWLCLRTLLWDSRAGGGGGLRSAAGGGDRSFLAIELHAGVRLAVPGDAGACAARPRVPRKFLSQMATDDDVDDDVDDGDVDDDGC